MEFKKKWINFHDLNQILSLKRCAILKLCEENQFPQPIRLSRRMIRWNIDAVYEWVRKQEAERFADKK